MLSQDNSMSLMIVMLLMVICNGGSLGSVGRKGRWKVFIYPGGSCLILILSLLNKICSSFCDSLHFLLCSLLYSDVM